MVCRDLGILLSELVILAGDIVLQLFDLVFELFDRRVVTTAGRLRLSFELLSLELLSLVSHCFE